MNKAFSKGIFIIISLIFLQSCILDKKIPAGAAKKGDKDTVTEIQNVTVTAEPAWAPKEYGYKPSEPKYFDLLHTKLNVSFDWESQELIGKAELTLKPYFYPQDTLVLDAKGFLIHSVMRKTGNSMDSVSYNYDLEKLTLYFEEELSRDDLLTLVIDYTARPEKLETREGKAITSDKGLYFINPLGKEDKPRQIWTQGETESSSCWFPTIDAPNERCTQEIFITVDSQFTTLSNGTLQYSRFSNDGKRTDYWKMEKPHAPYLFMMAIGEYAVVKDEWNDIEVNYYVEPEYEQYAKSIFGHTPEMMEFFSDKLDYEYPWPKYSQVVVRDFVSGAMENTTATTFLERIQMTDRELLDKNWDFIIAHELFHHWFGDLVTCESWANLALNESFANYSEYLWYEHKFGRDYADLHGLNEADEYFQESRSKMEPIIRFEYDKPDDMFDRHSYNKGGRVLHMLRKFVGDQAFFESLKKYLNEHEYTDVEIHELRLAFEEKTGQDMNWFFNQWFLSPGHPQLKVTREYDSIAKGLNIYVEQTQNTDYLPVFNLPLTVQYWVGEEYFEKDFFINKVKDTLFLPAERFPDLYILDKEQQLLAEYDHQKTIPEYILQYQRSPRFLARYTAIGQLAPEMADTTLPNILSVFKQAVDDPFLGIREFTFEQMTAYQIVDNDLLESAREASLNDSASTVRVAATNYLNSLDGNSDVLQEHYRKQLTDSSYSVVAAAFSAFMQTNPQDIEGIINDLKDIKNVDIAKAIASHFISNKDTTEHDWFLNNVKVNDPGYKFNFTPYYGQYLDILKDTSLVSQGINLLEEMALNHEVYYVRFAGYKALRFLNDRPKVKQKLVRIREAETNEMVKGAYRNMEGEN